MPATLSEGDTFPDYVLPDHTGVRRRLSALQGDQLMILVLTRGFFCPKDRQHMHELVRFHPQCVVGYTQIVTITTDDWHMTNNYRQQTAAPWPFLYDEERKVQTDLGIKEYTDTAHDVMIPHTIVLGRDLEVFRIYNGYYYWGRPSMAELHGDLRRLGERTYRDWDLTDPDLRRKWEAGEKSDFYPYGEESISMQGLMREMAGAVDLYAGAADDEER